MNAVWPLQDAKNKFSSVVEQALHHGPQLVTRHGKEAVVVLSASEFRKLTKPSESLRTFLEKSPLRSTPLDLDRNRDHGRKISL